MCDEGGCPSEAGSCSVGDQGPDAMLDILEEFQRLYRERMARLDSDPTSPTYGKDRMELLEDWIDDLNQQNRTLVQTVKELETEASQRCQMLESRLVSTTSSTKQYMLQLHQLQRQVQQLVSGRAQAQDRAAELTAQLDEQLAENQQLQRRLELGSDDHRPDPTSHRWQHWGPNDVITSPSSDQANRAEVSGHLERLKADLEQALHDKDDLQEVLDIRKCELEESQAEVARLRSEVGRLRATLGVHPPAAGRHQQEAPAEVHRLRKHCRDLVDQRNEALAELARVKVTLMEAMENQVTEAKEVTAERAEGERLSSTPAAVVEVPPSPPPPTVNRQPINSAASRRLQDQLEERDQLISDLQAHLASARNEVALKDETLARLEGKLETTRQELSATGERLAGAEGERAALTQQNQILANQVRELQLRAEEASAVSRRLESEADQQMAQITDLQERLLASETSGKQLTASCVEKDVQIGQQWTTISSLREALLESKQQLEQLQPAAGSSFFGGLLGSASPPGRDARRQPLTSHNQPQQQTVSRQSPSKPWQRNAESRRLTELGSQIDRLIMEKQHQHSMIRDLRSDLAASGGGDGSGATQRSSTEQRGNTAPFTSDPPEQRDRHSPQTEQPAADPSGRLQAQLAETRAQLAETLAGQEHVHAQADLIVELVSGWVTEWRAENGRLTRRVDQQADTIAALQTENRHLSDQLSALLGRASGSLPVTAAELYPLAFDDRRPHPTTLPGGCGGHRCREHRGGPQSFTRDFEGVQFFTRSNEGPPSFLRSQNQGPPSFRDHEGPQSFNRDHNEVQPPTNKQMEGTSYARCMMPQPETRADLSRRLCADAGCQAPRADQVPTRDGAGADHRRTGGLIGEDDRHGPGVWRAET
ncbi:unconventional myosin-XVIIIa-like [Amphibalanus amphitrite]|uniref:unconventional myosin-XVIIIa-like n=1 Tax=Amphibalanus amphitrite TaxID=1232801 RepID=UPI001C919C9B|nr:unconventional myosin-XVIIIa-like [Amphibalanus amphitrite]